MTKEKRLHGSTSEAFEYGWVVRNPGPALWVFAVARAFSNQIIRTNNCSQSHNRVAII
ncbi:hypothetical protein CNECB9_2200036 [Cupriavidus necator]|uniref:Uncharacterized protein n=1 Tax=Cupriavidus necator TaxID=106590 RepID=A0A1K0J7M0_CUPNE|nr:hypothetical protein CNECB9_2200036 [Cupriavidus necator]